MIEYSALYIQLMNNILDKMRRGEYQLGDRLDSERAMSQQYGINRMTVRKALKGLEEQGYVRAQRGSGTYVVKVPQADPRIEQGTVASSSLSVQVRQQGYEMSRTVVSFRKLLADGALAETFQGRQQLFEMVRLSKVNGKPYAVQKAYIPADIFWDADRYDFGEGSLYEYMDIQGRSPKRIESFLKIAQPPEAYAQLLELEQERKVYIFNYYGYDHADELVEYTESYYLPQYTSFRYVTEKSPRQAELSAAD